MKRALILICLLCLMFSPCTGETPLETKAVPGEAQFSRGYEAAREMADGVIGLRLMQSGCTYESWAGEALLKSAGAEWYVITLIQLGRPVSVAGSLAYLDAILEEPRVRSASERLKYALTYCALGVNDSEYIKTTADECPGAQGVMSYIYGLHLLNNGVLSDRFTAEKLAEELLALRKPDGGWSVMGNYSDTDVTAMALQALAPYFDKNEETKAAVDGALAFLAAKQVEGGAFVGFGGGENPESTAQVVIALTSLGIDPCEDARFIKDGHSALDGLLRFRLDDGSFCHELGSVSNPTATYQAFMAAVAAQRFYQGQGSLYLFDAPIDLVSGMSGEAAGEADEGTQTSQNETAVVEKTVSASSGEVKILISYKPYAIAGCAALAVIASLILWATGKRSIKNFLFIGACFLISVPTVLLTNFESTDSYYNRARLHKDNPVGRVEMSIRCDVIRDLGSKNEFIPADGVILPPTDFEFESGETAFDILTQAAREFRIQIDATGSALSMVYVKGINYIYEYEFGEQSGWMYYVNGVAPNVNSSEYILRDGDVIQWMYSRDIGQDLREYVIKPE